MSDKLHYIYWGQGPQALCGQNLEGCGTSNLYRVTCEECRQNQTYHNHLIAVEIAYEGNWLEFQDDLREKFFKGESDETK